MATKTISIDLFAYDRLCEARLTSKESFSQVIRRAQWPAPPTNAGALLQALGRSGRTDDETMARLERLARAS